MTSVRFDVIGTPKPQGSKRAFVRGNRAMLVESAGQPLKDWRTSVATAAALAGQGHDLPLDGPLHAHITFRFRRPASAPKRKRTWPTTRSSGDIDKLLRSTFDALADAGLIADDARIVGVSALKDYAADGEPTGASITVSEVQEVAA